MASHLANATGTVEVLEAVRERAGEGPELELVPQEVEGSRVQRDFSRVRQKRLPVQLRGRVTYLDESRRLMTLQDSGGASLYLQASRVAASLAYLLIRQQDSVGLAITLPGGN